jgi:hypothetical protein
MRFHLLHRPGGRDVFVMQYNHVLMDNNAAMLVLKEIERPSRATPDRAAATPAERRDPIWQHLRRFPRQRRRRAVQAAIDLWRRSLRGGVAMLGRAAPPRPDPARFGILTRSLDPGTARSWQSHVLQTCGFPSPSMALAASVFRAVRRLSPRTPASGPNFVVGVGVDLGLRGLNGPLFRNLMSVVPIHARADALDDPDALMRLLSRQMRDRLEHDIDLGVLALMLLFSRRPRQARWVIEPFLRHGFSLWYAYFGSLDAAGAQFAGAVVEDVFHAAASWSPVGLTLLANQYRGQLRLQATYVPEAVPEALAQRFLEAVLDDLTMQREISP